MAGILDGAVAPVRSTGGEGRALFRISLFSRVISERGLSVSPFPAS